MSTTFLGSFALSAIATCDWNFVYGDEARIKIDPIKTSWRAWISNLPAKLYSSMCGYVRAIFWFLPAVVVENEQFSSTIATKYGKRIIHIWFCHQFIILIASGRWSKFKGKKTSPEIYVMKWSDLFPVSTNRSSNAHENALLFIPALVHPQSTGGGVGRWGLKLQSLETSLFLFVTGR